MDTETERFAELMRELKERSGRSYGTLAKRLHSSNSTLHRYCNGQTVPTEYAPVERFAKVCGASADEMPALYQQWTLALAERRREPTGGGAAAGRLARTAVPRGEPVAPGSDSRACDETAPGPAPDRPAPHAPEPSVALRDDASSTPSAPSASSAPSTPSPASPTRVPTRPGIRRHRLIAVAAGVVAAMAAGTAVAVATLGGGGRTADTADARPAPASAPASRGLSPGAAADTAPGAASGTGVTRPPSPLGTPGGSASTGTTSSPAAPEADRGGSSGTPAPRSDAVPFTVSVQANNWGAPCDQWFALDQAPDKVPPPPARDATDGWAATLHAVPAGHLRLSVTVQGTDSTPVVLHALYVRTTGSRKAPAWNGYTMGAGCGGELAPASFAIDLDDASPRPRAVPGLEGERRTPVTDFPYKVSATDPQVLDIDASTLGQDVNWYLELAWSSGDRQRTTRIDDHGRPFRTTALDAGRRYWYNAAGPNAWVPWAS
ncbi:helix-turn-helix transcriptional regulator [Streptomyces sp. NPDC051162]|uniref:helix-turn-helix domain-containing protein n=1 Tax=Streptomyces sp. NPDC051162 TaxID=3154747 RepID=UPI003440FF88